MPQYLKPINTNVLIRLDSRETVSKGGIHLPEFSQTANTWGTIVEVSDKCRNVQRGMRVLVLPTQGTHYRQHGEDLILLNEERILCYEGDPVEIPAAQEEPQI
jgi:co-chaperonin GroES (HSP10)